jgi:predicted transcriptional regulator
MALAKEDIEFIKEHLGEWLVEVSLGKPPAVYEIELRERMVRVEEALKHQRELMRQGFEQVERRFEQIDKRFEQVEKRFEQVDKRFEQVDRRFDELIKRNDRHFLWLIGFITTVAALIIAAGNLL